MTNATAARPDACENSVSYLEDLFIDLHRTLGKIVALAAMPIGDGIESLPVTIDTLKPKLVASYFEAIEDLASDAEAIAGKIQTATT